MRLSTSLRLNAQKGLVTPYDPTLTLSLQFATRQAYVSDFGPLPTFTNATTTARTYVGSDGLLKTAGLNVPRIEFDPVTRQCLGLLIEEQRTNVNQNSADLSAGSWVPIGCTVTTNQTTAPDGTSDADLLSETSASSQHYIYGTTTAGTNYVVGTAYTASVFVKKGSGATAPDWIALRFIAGFAAGSGAAFNVTTGAFGTTTGVTTSVKNYGNGWWRVSITATATTVTAVTAAVVGFTNNTNSVNLTSYAGQTSSNLFVWGAQFEAGSFASSYIPTTTTSLVRSADVCAITGAEFTGFYNQTEGAMVFKGMKSGVQSIPAYLNVDDNTASNRHAIFNSGSTSEGYLVSSIGVDQATLSQTPQAAINTAFGMAVRYKDNDFALSVNGSTASIDTSGSLPTVNRMSIGNRVGAFFLCGHIRSIQYFNAIKTNAQLQALSTP